MNYQKIYNQIIQRAQKENRKRSKTQYYERHHILPKCLGGDNNDNNLVLLTAREHFICHKLLCDIYTNNRKLIYALQLMLYVKSGNQNRNYKISSHEYERFKILIRDNKLGVKRSLQSRLKQSNTNKGKVFSDEYRKKISDAKKGKTSWKKGLKMSEEYSINRKKIYAERTTPHGNKGKSSKRKGQRYGKNISGCV